MYQLIVDNFETGKKDEFLFGDLETAIEKIECELQNLQDSIICYIFKNKNLVYMRFK